MTRCGFPSPLSVQVVLARIVHLFSLSPHCVSPFSRGVIFTRIYVSHALLCLTKNGDYYGAAAE